jgi:hypothetical protein
VLSFFGVHGDIGELGELDVELDFDLRRWRLNLRPLLENHLEDFEALSVSMREVKTKYIYVRSYKVTTGHASV